MFDRYSRRSSHNHLLDERDKKLAPLKQKYELAKRLRNRTQMSELEKQINRINDQYYFI